MLEANLYTYSKQTFNELSTTNYLKKSKCEKM